MFGGLPSAVVHVVGLPFAPMLRCSLHVVLICVGRAMNNYLRNDGGLVCHVRLSLLEMSFQERLL